MVPGGVRTDGTTYSQALTQALTGSAVPQPQDPTQAQTPATPGSDAATAAAQSSDSTDQAPVQSLYRADTTTPGGNSQAGSGTAPSSTSTGQTGGQGQDAKAVSDTPTYWTPSGLAKIAAMYNTAEHRSGNNKGAIGADHLNILG